MTVKIPTVTGYISPDDLGLTSVHEHVPLDKAGAFYDDAFQLAVSDLKVARGLGLRSLVEVSPARDVKGIQRVAESAGVNILVCTGHYIYFTDAEKTYTVDQFRRIMMDEIEKGIDGTGIKPAVIKISSAKAEITEYEARSLTAAGMAQKESGLPVCTHAVAGCQKQQDLLEAAGADLSRVYFSHTEAEFGWEGRTLEQEIDYLTAVVRKGSTLCFNNFGNWAHTSPENLAGIINALIKRGFADHLVATMDFVWSYIEGKRVILWEDINPGGIRRTYSYLISDVVPWLRGQGVSEGNINKMMVDTPRRIFGG